MPSRNEYEGMLPAPNAETAGREMARMRKRRGSEYVSDGAIVVGGALSVVVCRSSVWS